MSSDDWLDEEETYLKNLSSLCQDLSGQYKKYYEIYKVVQARFRIPSIIVSSVTGLTSFGSSNFPPAYRDWVSIAVGIASLSIAIINSIESYMKIGEHLAGASQASIELHKLKEYIDIELAIPKDKRHTQGMIFLRDCYTRYERILEIAPDILKIVRFIRPSYDQNTDMGSLYVNNGSLSQSRQPVITSTTRMKQIFSLSSLTTKGSSIFMSPTAKSKSKSPTEAVVIQVEADTPASSPVPVPVKDSRPPSAWHCRLFDKK